MTTKEAKNREAILSLICWGHFLVHNCIAHIRVTTFGDVVLIVRLWRQRSEAVD